MPLRYSINWESPAQSGLFCWEVHSVHTRYHHKFPRGAKMAIIGTEKETNKINTLYKIVNGTLAVEIPNYFRQKERQTRNYHPLKFINAGCRTNIYKYSFFPRSVKEWNELPGTIIEGTNTEAFKLALRALARPHWAFEHFFFLYHQHKFTALFFSAHSTSTAHICWRWSVLPFADQTFRFRRSWKAITGTFFYWLLSNIQNWIWCNL